MATDVSPAAVERAKSGLYAQHEIDRGVTPPLLNKYFRQDGNNWQINDEMRRMVRFAVHNLLRPPPAPGPYDLIFCRNVTIYFKKDVRRQVFERLASRLTPEGHLFVGCSESLHDLGERFRPQRIGTASVYKPNAKTARV
jgi:chemotaxis protein methyltransferase CheR